MSVCMSGTRGSGVLSSTGDVLVECVTCVCVWLIGLDITRFCEQQRQPSSGSACPKNSKSGPHCRGRGGSTQFAQQLDNCQKFQTT